MKPIHVKAKALVVPLVLLLSVFVMTPTAQSQIKYRGFVEGGIGGASLIETPHFGYMLSTTHGIQWEKNFFGLGVGIATGYCKFEDMFIMDQSSGYYIHPDKKASTQLSLPIFLNWRYDFFSQRNWNYYAGIKAGVNLFIATSAKVNYFWHNTQFEDNRALEQGDAGTILFGALNFGVRKRLTSTSGLSFGLSIQTNKSIVAPGPTYFTSNGWKFSYAPYCIFDLAVLATVGFDF